MEHYFEINENGHNIRCKLYHNKGQEIKKMIISCHGFAGHKDNHATQKFAEKILSKYKGIGVITFNFPCHGDDVKKKMILKDCLTYLELVISHVQTQYPIEELYAYATSFGGYVVLKYMIEGKNHTNPFKKIALRCPAVNMYEVLQNSIMKSDDYEKMKKGRAVPVGFDRKVDVTQSFLDELRDGDIQKYEYIDFADDLLILHGTNDTTVSFDKVKEFAEENVIEFIPVEQADHRFRNPAHMEIATKAVLIFFGIAK